jgi:multimeric flavodoxin WrbA
MAPRTLVLSSSPREDGNSHLLAESAITGAEQAGHDVTHLFLHDWVQKMLGNCKTCRLSAESSCSLDDKYKELLFEHILPADGIVFAMPLYFYGMPARLKTVIDRRFCFMSPEEPEHEFVLANLADKKIAALITCEETYQGATLGLIAQLQEMTRYLKQDLVGVVVGRGNSRGEVAKDPNDPVGQANLLAQQLFTATVTDYRFDTPRSNSVWH